MRNLNVDLVRRALKTAGEATRQQLAGATGLSVVTVNAALRTLVVNGEAVETAQIPSNGGRPSQVFRFQPAHSHVLVAFSRETNGRDTVCFRVADLAGTVAAQEELSVTPQSLEDFVPVITRLLSEFPSIRALGFALPGYEIDGTVMAMDYPGLVGTRPADFFGALYALPVAVENDVNAAALGFGRKSGSGTDDLGYVYFPEKYPPGAGILINGALVKGRRHFAGEVSRIPLGIDWTRAGLYADFQAACDAVARVAATLTSVVDPEVLVLHGEFLTEGHLGGIRDAVGAYLPGGIGPEIVLSSDFTQDLQDGIIARALALLESHPMAGHGT
jgi:predicted NBD/HSP70 family sugar kinase